MYNKIGKRFVFGLPGKEVTPFIEDMILNFGLFGIILFNRNFDSIVDLKILCHSLKSIRSDLIIMIDQEGGEKSRIRQRFPNHPSNRRMGQKYTEDTVRKAYKQSAISLKKLGIDMNLAPVVDLGMDGSYIYERAFSWEYKTVTKYALSAIDGLHAGGLYCCAKHFVGIGCTEIDPHKKLPLFFGELKYHLMPFVSCALHGVDAIMTTHIVLPEVSEKPITVSKRAIDILRDNVTQDGLIPVGFDGPIFTDDLLMGGATEYSDTASVTIESFAAGHDVALICHEEKKQEEAIQKFISELKESKAMQQMHENSLLRLNKYFHI